MMKAQSSTATTNYQWQDEFGTRFAAKKVLVTGATGFIGGHLCEALHTLGARLYALGLEAAAPPYIHAEQYISVDLGDFETIQHLISEIQPDLIFHLAGLVTTSRERDLVLPMLQNNLLSTVHLLLAATDSSCQRIVITGTAEEPDGNNGEAAPTSPYAAAKAAGTLYARMFHRLYNLPVVLVRPFVVYGPRQHPSKLIPYTILSLLRRERPEIRSANRVCDFVYVVDLVRGLLMTALAPEVEGEIIDLGSGTSWTIRDVVVSLATLIRASESVEMPQQELEIEEQALVADIQSTSLLIGWKPLWAFPDGLAESVAWYSSSGCMGYNND